MCMTIPFYLRGYFVIDMCLGSLNKVDADALGPAAASGMIYGDLLWSVLVLVFTIFNINPPMCMKFLLTATNTKADDFLDGF